MKYSKHPARNVRVTTASGDVTIGASESNVIEVTLSVRILRSNACSTRRHRISTGKRIRWSFGLERMRTSTPCVALRPRFVVAPGSSSVDRPRCPHRAAGGSSVEVMTASGDTEIIGGLAKAHGDQRVPGMYRSPTKWRSRDEDRHPGDVTTATVRESLTCHRRPRASSL